MRVLQAKTKRPLDLLAIGAGGHVAAASSAFGVRGDVEVWEIATGQHVFQKRDDRVRGDGPAFMFGPRHLVIADDKRIVFRSQTDWDANAEFESDWPIIALSTDEHLLLVIEAFSHPGYEASSVGCWVVNADLTFRKLWRDGPHEFGLFDHPSISPDGKTVALYSVLFSRDRTQHLVKVLEGMTGSMRTSVEFPRSDPVLQLAYSADSSKLLARSSGRVVKVFDAATGQPAGELVHPGRPYVTGMAVHPNGTVACSRNTGTVCFWNLEKCELVRTLDWKLGKLVSVAFSPDGSLGAAGTEDGQVVVWDVDF